MNPSQLPPEVWEALCRRCGKCCAEKVEVDGKIYITRKMCRFLNTESRQCTVYKDRFRAEPDCLSTLEGLPMMVFPADCPYTKTIENYIPPLEDWDDPAVDAAIRELLGEDALPEGHK
jgi:uncharacterized cysteine cluster protein YcgN (CxxCxxCC family)